MFPIDDLDVLMQWLPYVAPAAATALAAYHRRLKRRRPAHKQRYDWAIDCGHGRLQAGKRSPVLTDGRQLLEYLWNRQIGRPLIERLRAAGVSCWEVVPEDEVGSFLRERTQRINRRRSKLSRLALSIHANAGPAGPDGWSAAHGVETFHFPFSDRGRAMAKIFQRHLVEQTGLRNRGVREANFYILKNTTIPTILLECGFFNNPREVLLLLDPAFRAKVIEALFLAIMEIERHGL